AGPISPAGCLGHDDGGWNRGLESRMRTFFHRPGKNVLGHRPQPQRQPLNDQPPMTEPPGLQSSGVKFFWPGPACRDRIERSRQRYRQYTAWLQINHIINALHRWFGFLPLRHGHNGAASAAGGNVPGGTKNDRASRSTHCSGHGRPRRYRPGDCARLREGGKRKLLFSTSTAQTTKSITTVGGGRPRGSLMVV